jgi:hypothetical protein
VNAERDVEWWTQPPIYRPGGAGESILLYGGEILLQVDGVSRRCYGEVKLEDGPKGPLIAHVAGNDGWMASGWFSDHFPPVELPPDASLNPPAESAMPTKPEHGSWVDWPIHINHLEHGDIARSERFLIHMSGDLGRLPVHGGEDEDIGAIVFELPGWRVRLRVLGESVSSPGFSHIADCVAMGATRTPEEVHLLRTRLFTVLSLIAGSEVGLGPVAGVDSEQNVCWVSWDVGRHRSRRPGAGWCTDKVVEPAVTAVADGITGLAADPAMEKVVHRATGHLLASAAGQEVLDVRIPTACSGIELVAWAFLQRREWLGADALARLPASAIARLLMKSCSIPTEIPGHFEALSKRRTRIGHPDWSASEILFNVRNSLVHPPRKLDEPEWPTSDELFEAWQLATWILELSLLHALGYNGEYWCRLRLGRSGWDTEPVPWAAPGS